MQNRNNYHLIARHCNGVRSVCIGGADIAASYDPK